MGVYTLKKISKADKINLFFSAFLILAFIICAHFFTQFTATIPGIAGSIITALIYVVFGFLMFYATRVGDGKAVKRFSLITLLIMCVPSLYIIIASFAPGMLFHDVFVSTSGQSVIVTLACVAFGYGIPYSFFSGFELKSDSDEVTEEEPTMLEGGIEADIAEADTAESESAEEENNETSADEATDAQETEENTVEESEEKTEDTDKKEEK